MMVELFLRELLWPARLLLSLHFAFRLNHQLLLAILDALSVYAQVGSKWNVLLSLLQRDWES